MPEQQAKPPRVHLISCLYVVAGLLLIYLVCLRLSLPSTTPFRLANESIAVTPFAHSDYLPGMLVASVCLALSYWERYRWVSILAGLIAIFFVFGILSIFFVGASWGFVGILVSSVFYEHEFEARVTADLSYYPCKYIAALLAIIMVLRLFEYRPTTFRLTLLDMMLITIAVAVILGSRGIAMKLYSFS